MEEHSVTKKNLKYKKETNKENGFKKNRKIIYCVVFSIVFALLLIFIYYMIELAKKTPPRDDHKLAEITTKRSIKTDQFEINNTTTKTASIGNFTCKKHFQAKKNYQIIN